MSLTHLSLFSGIGGLDLAAEAAGFKTAGQCEWADYPTKVLEKHWPDVPRWRDIRTLTGESFYERTGLRTVDIISGGFPCQPFSFAGKRRGKEDDRYLWTEMLRVIQEIGPGWVIGENVAGIVNLALDQVLSDLENIGYACQAFIVPACAVDAAHRRDRVAIVAWNANSRNGNAWPKRKVERGKNAESAGICADVSNSDTIRCGLWGSERERIYGDTTRNEADSGCETVANPESIGLQRKRAGWEQIRRTRFTEGEPQRNNHACDATSERLSDWATLQMGKSGKEQELKRPVRRPTEPGLGGMADGVPSWMDRYWVVEPDIPRITTNKKNLVDRLKCLGNAVYWRQFYPFFKCIAQIEEAAHDEAE